MALRVEGDGQSIWIVSSTIVQEYIADPKDTPVIAESHLGFVDLLPLLGSDIEVLPPVLDPFDGPG